MLTLNSGSCSLNFACSTILSQIWGKQRKKKIEAQSSMEGPINMKARTAAELQAVKRKSGKTYGQIAEETGLTNVYVAQLLRRQAQLKPATAPLLRAALPALTDDLLQEMMQPPLRSYDPNLIQEPTVYRSLSLLLRFPD